MELVSRSLVTVIAEDELEQRLTNDLTMLGVKGYTLVTAHGKGMHRERISEWEGKNIIVEILTTHENAEKILKFLADTYFGKYSITAFVTETKVLRGEKYA